jgi:hypothetical protein
MGKIRITFVASGIGVAGQVEPEPGPALTVTLIGKESVDELTVGLGILVSDEGLDSSRLRG